MTEKNLQAHPQRTPLEEVKASLLYLKSLGLQGVECTDEAAKLLGTLGRATPQANSRRPASRQPVAQAGSQGIPKQDRPPIRPGAGRAASEATPHVGHAAQVKSPATPMAGELKRRPRVQPVVETLESIREDLGECTRCGLFRGRNQIVFGVGNPQARLMFIGDMPLSDEDRQGVPFLGVSGELLNKMIHAMGLSRDEVYLSNLLKCCPAPQQRRPDVSTCLSFLERQIAVVRPEVICALGAVAAQTLLGITSGVAGIRGQFQNYKGIRLMPTFHPTFLLRHPEHKRQAWQDLQQVMAVLKNRG
ncbi:uracil-DNA glycosylase [Desulfoluna sp.]|uniref:uracil-DNA glycosylase n=1 Tax=Desulfoluna sp. TaxID=2045199 RepID=UPI002620F0C9|nr:uracil-DNA glycosylase [Desulfoluna sp.]